MANMLLNKEISIQACMYSVFTQNKQLCYRSSKKVMAMFNYTKIYCGESFQQT